MAKIRELCCFLLLAFAIAKVSEASSEIGVYELKRGNFSVKLTNYGATVVSVILPDRNGMLSFSSSNIVFENNYYRNVWQLFCKIKN